MPKLLYDDTAKTLAGDIERTLMSEGGFGSLSLKGDERLHGWHHAGQHTFTLISSINGIPVVVRVSVRIESPGEKDANNQTD